MQRTSDTQVKRDRPGGRPNCIGGSAASFRTGWLGRSTATIHVGGGASTTKLKHSVVTGLPTFGSVDSDPNVRSAWRVAAADVGPGGTSLRDQSLAFTPKWWITQWRLTHLQ